MSYDASMTIDTGGPDLATVAEIGNCTSNVSGMWLLALGEPLRDLDGRTGAELIPLLERAVSHIRHPSHAAVYRGMEPSNGWGSHEGAARYLERILAACRAHPLARLEIDS